MKYSQKTNCPPARESAERIDFVGNRDASGGSASADRGCPANDLRPSCRGSIRPRQAERERYAMNSPAFLWAGRAPVPPHARCVLNQSRSASSMRACHPLPVARKAASTSGLYRTDTCSFFGRFPAPRFLRSASFFRCSSKDRLTMTSGLFQNASTDAASFGSYGQSGSSTVSGAAAIRASHVRTR